ncbi:alpha/beta fold hydrolase [Candidatus Sumerlaeota bacterium]|nr:alpha/beta fold hydrolase [Candidatus Sumerlaeota bacterium]
MAQLPKEIQQIYPFTSRWMEIGGNRLHYLDEGSGEDRPTVVLLHGNPTWSFIYREIIPKIRPHCRAVAPDYLGMGLSDKPPDERLYTLENHTKIVTELIEKLGLKKIILVVQDWGGPIGLGYALAHPENVAGMLIMNTWAWPEPSLFHASVMPWRMMHAPVIGAHFFLRRNILVERGLYLSTGNREKLKRGPVLFGYRLPFSSPLSRIAMLAFPRNIPLHPGDLNWERMEKLKEGLKTIPFPCRLLWGAKDNVFPPANAEVFQKLIPNCPPPRLIPEGMHFVQEDAPDEIAEEILILAGRK